MRPFWLVINVALLLVLVACGGNWAALDRKVQNALSDDPRNNHVSMRAYLAWGVDPSTLVLDVRGMDGQNSMADVDRIMLTALKSLKEYSFTKVVLAYRGSHKFQMLGSYAQALGQEYGLQNPLYTMRTMQEHIYRPDGSPAFGTWTGGWLGVMNKQMEDHNKFHQDWYMTAAAENQ